MKLTVFLMALGLSMTANAGTLDQVVEADCSSAKGSYLKMNRDTEVLTAKFAGLPELSNYADGDYMPIETDTSDGYTSVRALTVNFPAQLLGSVSLVTKAGTDLSNQTELLVLFRNMTGDVQQEVLDCTLTGF